MQNSLPQDDSVGNAGQSELDGIALAARAAPPEKPAQTPSEVVVTSAALPVDTEQRRVVQRIGKSCPAVGYIGTTDDFVVSVGCVAVLESVMTAPSAPMSSSRRKTALTATRREGGSVLVHAPPRSFAAGPTPSLAVRGGLSQVWAAHL